MKNLRQYEIVIEISKQGSISKAADAMHISQPTLSKLLLKTESEVGIELFNRSTIPIKLDEAGERFFLAGQRVLDMLQRS